MATGQARAAEENVPAPAGGEGPSRRARIFAILQRRGAIVVLLLVVAIASLRFDSFLTARNLENIVLQASFLGLIAVGMTFVIISGGIDLSVGSMLALGGVLAALVLPAAAAYAVRPWGGAQTWAGYLDWPHYLVVLVCGFLLGGAAGGRWRPRSFRRMKGISTTR